MDPGLEFVNCLGCGRSVPKYAFRNGISGSRRRRETKYCSNKCVGLGHRKNRSGPNSPYWKGGKYMHRGYIIVTVQDGYRKGKRVPEHVILYEQMHKCCLLQWSAVHHINGNRSDNRLDNLIAMTAKHHNDITQKENSQFIKLARTFNWDEFVN